MCHNITIMEQAISKPREPDKNIFDIAHRLVKLQVGVRKLELENFEDTFTRNRLVKYQTIAGMPKMEKARVGVGGYTTRLPKEVGLLFLTELEPFGYIGPHYHTDCVEVVHVLEGEVLEKHTGTKYVAGETHRVTVGTVHHYVGLKPGARLLVEIYQPSWRSMMRATGQFWLHMWQRIFGIYPNP